MGRGSAPENEGASGAAGYEDDLSAQLYGGSQHRTQRREEHMNEMRAMFSGLFNLPGVGLLGLGGKPTSYAKETLIGDTWGQGATSGLPTTDENGDISLVYRQVFESLLQVFVYLLTRALTGQPGRCGSSDCRH